MTRQHYELVHEATILHSTGISLHTMLDIVTNMRTKLPRHSAVPCSCAECLSLYVSVNDVVYCMFLCKLGHKSTR